MADVLTRDRFGDVLRTWRGRRNRSQLALASLAGVSQRHISFLETGRSRPSREMVMHLGMALDLPLRDRNAMLIAAGFAPVFPERRIDHPDLVDIRNALEAMLRAHEPFPAYVVDRQWNIMLANNAAMGMIAALPDTAQAVAANMARLVFHPDGLRSSIVNWDEAAPALLRRLEREADDAPADRDLAALLAEVRSFPGTPTDATRVRVPAAHEVLLPLRLRRADQVLSFFTTIATLASPVDITVQELRLETLLPADPETEAFLRAMQQQADPTD